MTRDTSIDAYREIEENGLLGKRAWEVYQFLSKNGPCTAKHIIVGLMGPTQNSGGYTTRLSELKKKGVVRETGKVTCEYSGFRVFQWEVIPGALPLKQDDFDRMTRAEIIDGLCVLLEEILPRVKPTGAAGIEWVDRTKSMLATSSKYR